jgi:hypothetical protein
MPGCTHTLGRRERKHAPRPHVGSIKHLEGTGCTVSFKATAIFEHLKLISFGAYINLSFALTALAVAKVSDAGFFRRTIRGLFKIL